MGLCPPSSLLSLRMIFPSYLASHDGQKRDVISEDDDMLPLVDRRFKLSHESRTQQVKSAAEYRHASGRHVQQRWTQPRPAGTCSLYIRHNL